MRREFLQLAHTFKGQDISGFYISEKLDGTRCLWDGGVSRGMNTTDVPYASIIDPRKGGYKKKIKPKATGLWSRYGNPIMAPDWFLDRLPPIPLDGELWAGRGNFQLCRSICAGDEPDPRFDQLQFAVYSTPPLHQLFMPGQIKNTNMILDMTEYVQAWFEALMQVDVPSGACFEEELDILEAYLPEHGSVYVHRQQRLTDNPDSATAEALEYSRAIAAGGGEGAILRDPAAQWTPKRNNGILKLKPVQDDEGVLVGFTSGKKTNKGSKHLGKIGALILSYRGKRLDLSGMTDEEREFETGLMREYAAHYPGCVMPASFQGEQFKIGQLITFTYRDLSDEGIPKEARFLRVRRDHEN